MRRSKPSSIWGAALVALSAACGGAQTRDASGLRSELESVLEAARERAEPTVVDAEQALTWADEAEARDDLEAAAEHRAAARLLAARATAIASARAEDEARAVLEAESAQLLEEALAIEAEAEALEADATRLAAARAAREEALRALTRAEADEARGRRVGRLSLDDAAAMRTAARDIRRRARLLLSAATAIAARSEHEITDLGAETERLSTASEEADEPLEALRQADAAHDAARAALGRARRGLPVTAASVAALLEACESEGFTARALERGIAIDVEAFFPGTGRTPSREGAPRLGRLGALLGSHPTGPIVIEVHGELAAPRAQAIRAALIEAGIEETRLELSTTEEGRGMRVLLAAYAAPTPGTATRLLGEAPAEGGVRVDARPAPDAMED